MRHAASPNIQARSSTDNSTDMPNPNGHVVKLKPPWRRGECGNARGKLATYRDVLRLARTNSPGAVRTLIQCMNDPNAPWPARVAAAHGLLDRAWGKAPQDLAVDSDSAAFLRIQFVDAGDTTTVTIQRPTAETTINSEARDDEDKLRLSFDADQ